MSAFTYLTGELGKSPVEKCSPLSKKYAWRGVMKFVFLFVWVSRNISISAPRVYRNGVLVWGVEP
jgi:hypothetical protein